MDGNIVFTQKKSKKKPILIIIGIIIGIIIAGIVALGVLGSAVDKSDTQRVIVTVEQGSGTADIASLLSENGLIKSEPVFKLKSKLGGYDGKYQAGTYAFTKSMSMSDMMKMMRDGKTAGNTFQVADGDDLKKIATNLEDADICTAEEFYNEVENGDFDYEFIKYLPEGEKRLEGFLYPNTYEFPMDASAHDVVDTMLKGFDDAMEAEGIYDEVDGEELYTIITEASIIQKEASSADEMDKVASVIENRLDIDMPLQMCSTLAYATGNEKIKATDEDIQYESPYNTYLNKGLPPGPIASPAMDAIKAAVNPADTDYLYFVSSPKMDGTNVYSETYEEFLEDKEAFDEAYAKYIEEHPGEE